MNVSKEIQPCADAIFTHSSFGGGWILPLSEADHDLVWHALYCDGVPRWSDGHLVEPYEVSELIEWAQDMGVTVDGLPDTMVQL